MTPPARPAKSCVNRSGHGKVPYATRSAARKAARLSQHRIGPKEVYRCDFCRAYHLGQGWWR
jgi:hypothetical protein